MSMHLVEISSPTHKDFSIPRYLRICHPARSRTWITQPHASSAAVRDDIGSDEWSLPTNTSPGYRLPEMSACGAIPLCGTRQMNARGVMHLAFKGEEKGGKGDWRRVWMTSCKPRTCCATLESWRGGTPSWGMLHAR